MPLSAPEYVEVVVFRRTRDVISFLLLKRSPGKRPYPGIWQVVSGRKVATERATETALREVREETGVDPDGAWLLPFVNTFYSPDGDVVHSVPAFAAEVPESAEIVLSGEHSEYRWVSRAEAEVLVQWPSHLTMMDLVQNFVTQERGDVGRFYPHDLRKAAQ